MIVMLFLRRKNLVFLINLNEVLECLVGRIVGISLVDF